MSKVYINDETEKDKVEEIVIDNGFNPSGGITIKDLYKEDCVLTQEDLGRVDARVYVNYDSIDNLIKGLQKAKELWYKVD